MSYLYSGEFTFREGDEDNIETIIDILRVADEEFLDDVSSVDECVVGIQKLKPTYNSYSIRHQP